MKFTDGLLHGGLSARSLLSSSFAFPSPAWRALSLPNSHRRHTFLGDGSITGKGLLEEDPVRMANITTGFLELHVQWLLKSLLVLYCFTFYEVKRFKKVYSTNLSTELLHLYAQDGYTHITTTG